MKIKYNSEMIAGAVFVIVAAVLWLLIPSQIQTMETSSINAQTIPRVAIGGLFIFSAALLIQGIFSDEKREVVINKDTFHSESFKNEMRSVVFAVCVIFIPEVRHGSTVESITNLFQSKECFWHRMALSIGYYPTVIVLAFQYSLHIGIYVLLGLCVSVFCTNRYVFYAMPFLLTRIGMYIGGFVGLYAYIPYGRELLADGGWGICLTRNLAAYAVLGFLYYREMKWRGING